jgi:hypothetical protein
MAHRLVGAIEGTPQECAVRARTGDGKQHRLSPARGEEGGVDRGPRLEAAGRQEPLDRQAPPREPREREHGARAHRAPLAGQAVLHDQIGGHAGGCGIVEDAPQERRRDVEGHVPDDPVWLVRERHGERVALDDGHTRMAREPPAKPLDQPRIELDRDDPSGYVGERGGQPAGARADLDHEIGPRDAGRGDHLGGEAGASEKVLPVSVPGAMAATPRGHGTSP